MGRVTTRAPRIRVDLRGQEPLVVSRPDTLVVEEPLEIRVGATSVTTTMRTPGDDFDLALGHLVTEGLVTGTDDVAGMMHCTDVGADGQPTFNVVEVTLAPGAQLRREPRVRTQTATSACGICGSESVEEVLGRRTYAVGDADLRLDPRVVPGLLRALRSAQAVWSRTGGLHAAALFDAASLGEPYERDDPAPLVVREDVGRHNAVDKVVGWATRNHRLPLTGTVLVVSARAGFEILAKAAAAGIPLVVAVSAPSSLAVELAQSAGVTLVAFAREESFSVYAGSHRLALPSTVG